MANLIRIPSRTINEDKSVLEKVLKDYPDLRLNESNLDYTIPSTSRVFNYAQPDFRYEEIERERAKRAYNKKPGVLHGRPRKVAQFQPEPAVAIEKNRSGLRPTLDKDSALEKMRQAHTTFETPEVDEDEEMGPDDLGAGDFEGEGSGAVECAYCNNPIDETMPEIFYHGNLFCSRACARKFEMNETAKSYLGRRINETKKSLFEVGQIVVVTKEGDDNSVLLNKVTDALKQKGNELVKNNPRGFRDEWEQRFDTLCEEVAQEMGAKISFSKNGATVFNFSGMKGSYDDPEGDSAVLESKKSLLEMYKRLAPENPEFIEVLEAIESGKAVHYGLTEPTDTDDLQYPILTIGDQIFVYNYSLDGKIKWIMKIGEEDLDRPFRAPKTTQSAARIKADLGAGIYNPDLPADQQTVTPGMRRPPGRPRIHPKVVIDPNAPKGKRGRPRKIIDPNAVPVEKSKRVRQYFYDPNAESEPEIDPDAPKRPVGRPRKAAQEREGAIRTNRSYKMSEVSKNLTRSRMKSEVIGGSRISVWDSGPKFFDRYTVVYLDTYGSTAVNPGKVMYVNMSTSPFSPRGVNQTGEMLISDVAYKGRGGVFEKRITFAELPPDCQKVVLRDIKELKPDSIKEESEGISAALQLIRERYARLSAGLIETKKIVKENKFCKKCGVIGNKDHVFCPDCGTKLVSKTVEAKKIVAEEEPEEPLHRKSLERNLDYTTHPPSAKYPGVPKAEDKPLDNLPSAGPELGVLIKRLAAVHQQFLGYEEKLKVEKKKVEDKFKPLKLSAEEAEKKAAEDIYSTVAELQSKFQDMSGIYYKFEKIIIGVRPEKEEVKTVQKIRSAQDVKEFTRTFLAQSAPNALKKFEDSLKLFESATDEISQTIPGGVMLQKPPYFESDISKMMADFGKKIVAAINKLVGSLKKKIAKIDEKNEEIYEIMGTIMTEVE